MLRRNFIRLFAGSAAFSWLGLGSQRAVAADIAFNHGVASGDPLTDRLILWTRVRGVEDRRVDVRWAVAADANMQSIIIEGVVNTGAERDFTVKVDAGQLPTGQTLWYQFDADGVQSPVGQSKTLPDR